MLHRLALLLALLALPHASGLADTGAAAANQNRCLNCHAAAQTGFSTAHAFAAENCAACHAGDPLAVTGDAAHNGLIAFPGELATAERACGACHARRIAGVSGNLMTTGHGIVHKTRAVIDGAAAETGSSNFQSLGDSVADSLLRKQCASCHLGQPKTTRALDVTRDRGGGCLACHVNDYPDNAHPALTVRVDDGRCFGCHSRSGRISLSYAGLAEVPPPEEPGDVPGLRLADGRPVERLPADAHNLAGMSCIDCHTSVGLMGAAGDASHQREAVDVACTDCHGNGNPRLALRDWPAELSGMRKHLPFEADAGSRFLTTSNRGTPLWHIELRDDGAWLHTKNTGRVLRIPQPAPGHPGDDLHARLTCAACHSQWAPQCFGCHLEFDQDGEQWDHIARSVTPGRWSDRFWHADNGLPALGVNDKDAVDVFVPGMIMTVDHPDLGEAKFLRRFAPLSPHTTGASRRCESCHRASSALGLGDGDIGTGKNGIEFRPRHDRLQDGLPADAWTNVDHSLGGRTTLPGQRPFTQEEMTAILGAEIKRAD
jgi:hypothetical protein